MTRERSAGVIVFRQDLFGRREYLLLDHGRHWDFPKGHVDPGETDAGAAMRELREETGIADARLIDGFCREVQYVFRARKEAIHKTVVYFLARTDADAITLSHEHTAFAWLAYDHALARVSYANSKDLLRRAEAHLLPAAGTPEAG